MKDQQSRIFVFIACLTIPSSNYGHQPRRATVFHTWAYRATSRERNFTERIKAPIFLKAALAIETSTAAVDLPHLKVEVVTKIFLIVPML